jgi:effector-binding domain-containing protein
VSDIEIRIIERQPAAVVTFTCPAGTVAQQLGSAYGEIGGYLHDAGLEHEDAEVYARFLSLGPDLTVEAGFTVPQPVEGRGRVVPGELPGGEVAVAHHTGPYSELPQVGAKLREWVLDRGREMAGPPWEVYLNDPQLVPASELETEVFIPLR